MTIETLFERYANVCRTIQRKAIELENDPDQRKQLRRFQAREAADILGISQSHLRNLVRSDGFPPGELTGNGRRLFRIDDIHQARKWLAQTTGNPRYKPHRQPGQSLKTVTFLNFKGGSGKTTTAVHFAQYMALHGYRVLLADLDPQASATSLFGVAPHADVDPDKTFAGWIRRKPGDDPGKLATALPRITHWPGLHLLPAAIALQHAEYELMGKLIKERTYPFYDELRELIRHLDDRYDLVVCDCRPDVGMLTINALIAANGLIVPMPPSMIDFASSGEFFDFMAGIAQDFHANVSGSMMNYDFVRILTTKHRPADKNQSEIVAWKNAFFREAVLDHVMLETAVLDAAGLVKETLYEFEPPSNRRSYDRAIEAMNKVNSSIEDELHKAWQTETGEIAA